MFMRGEEKKGPTETYVRLSFFFLNWACSTYRLVGTTGWHVQSTSSCHWPRRPPAVVRRSVHAPAFVAKVASFARGGAGKGGHAKPKATG